MMYGLAADDGDCANGENPAAAAGADQHGNQAQQQRTAGTGAGDAIASAVFDIAASPSASPIHQGLLE